MSINRCGPCKRSAKTHPHSRKSPRRLRRHSKIWEKQRAAHPRGAAVCLCAKTLAGKARGGCADRYETAAPLIPSKGRWCRVARTKKQAKPNRKPHWMDLPIELRVGQPRITLVGSGPVFVENHSGLLAYTTKRIQFHTGEGLLTITGTHLTLDCMASGAVRIGGRVQGVALEGGEQADA